MKNLLIVLIALIIALFLFSSMTHDETKEINMHLNVDGYTGFNVDTDAVYFGTIAPSGIGSRTINIADVQKISQVKIKVYGEIKDWISVSENNFVINPGENKSVEIIVSVPKDAEIGEYEGVLKIKFEK